MVEPSPISRAESLPKMSVIRERLRNIGKDAVIAEAMDKDDSWIRKVRNNESGVLLDDIPRLLDAIGLKIVDKAKMCVHRDVAQAYETISRRALNKVDLIWDESE